MHDPELERLRDIRCTVLLENASPPWQLHRRDSTRNAQKFRRGAGEILIVNHEGRGWWDPTSDAKGDVFSLAQHLNPGLNFGEVRQLLRPLAGLPSTPFPDRPAPRQAQADEGRTPAERWNERGQLTTGSPGHGYLAEARGIPPAVLEAARAQDIIRQGAYGSAWFAHRDTAGDVTHVEIRGVDYKGSLSRGHKTLFRLAGGPEPTRLAVTEGAVNALSLAALEGTRPDTLYLATGGGVGPATERALVAEIIKAARRPGASLAIATDPDIGGEAIAARLLGLGRDRIATERLRPEGKQDWNDVLRAQAAQPLGTPPDARQLAAAERLQQHQRIDYDAIREAHRTLFEPHPKAGLPRRETAGQGTPAPHEAAVATERALEIGRRHLALEAAPGSVLATLHWARPFDEGNGAALKVVFTELLRRQGLQLDWGRISGEQFRTALAEDARGNRSAMNDLVRPALQRIEAEAKPEARSSARRDLQFAMTG